MIVKEKRKNTVNNSMDLNDLFTKKSSILFRIEKEFQRNYEWDLINIDRIFNEFYNIIETNIGCNEEPYEELCEFGQIDISTLYEHNKVLYDKKYKVFSIVDGSQRIRTLLCLFFALLYIKSDMESLEYVDFDVFMDKNKKYYKIDTIGDDDISSLIKYFNDNKISSIKKEIKNIDKYIKLLDKQGAKKLLDVFYYFVCKLQDVEINDINYFINIFKCACYFKVEEVEEEYKMYRFNDRNSKGVYMSLTDLYSREIINAYGNEKVKPLFDSYIKLEKLCKQCEEKCRYINGRYHKNALSFVMTEVLKIIIGIYNKNENNILKHVFKSDFLINNSKYGIEQVLFSNKICLKNYDEAIEYFSICYDFCKFLMEYDKNHENELDDIFYFKQYSSSNNVLYSFYAKPIFLSKICLDNEKKKWLMDVLFRAVYVVDYMRRGAMGSSSVQPIINLLEEISHNIILYGNKDYNEFVEIMKKIIYKNQLDYITLKSSIKTLNYNNDNHKNCIKIILSCLEYDFFQKYSLNKDSLFKCFVYEENGKKKISNFDIDHILPKMKENDENRECINSIGNLILLDSHLNKRKSDNTEKNGDLYMQSTPIITRLMNNNYFGSFSNDVIKNISNEYYIKRYSEDKLNNYSYDDINERTETISNFIVNFIKKPLIDG